MVFDWVSNAKHLGNVIDDKLSDLKDINAKKCHFIASVNWFVGNFRGKVKCLLNVIFDYFSHTAVPIMAQFYGHYMIEVLTIFA